MLESYFNKIANLKVSNFIKKRLWHRCFPVNIAKFLRKPILKNICEWLLLQFLIKMYLLYAKSMGVRVGGSESRYIPTQGPKMELFDKIANCYFHKKLNLMFEICLKWFWIRLCITSKQITFQVKRKVAHIKITTKTSMMKIAF